MLDRLKEKNPDIKMYSVLDEEFRTFGRIIKDVDTREILKVAKQIELQEVGVRYLASEENFEKLAIAEEIRNEVFGTLPTEIGYCWGHSSFLNATEWHTSSEINIAVTPIVLFLGHLWEIEDGKTDASKFTAFFVPEGVAIEVYATTTHYCPCQVQDEGFGCVVVLPKETNTQLEVQTKDKLMTAKNKWVVAHNDNHAMIARGITAGISGENLELKY